MKKLLALALTLVLCLSLAACSVKDKVQNAVKDAISGENSSGASKEDGKIDIDNAVDNIVKEAITADAFSEEAAAQALSNRGISVKAIAPDWDYIIDDTQYRVYGDSSHGKIEFIKKDGEISTEEYNAWLKKLFEATAAASDDGHNIEGFSFGNGDVEYTWDTFINSESWMKVWAFKYKGTIMDVYPEVNDDPENESEYTQDENGQWGFVYHYKSVAVDIADGLQKSFDETWQEMEDYFAEHEDEIRDALEDFAG
jgi:hypothetical protein